MVNEQFVKHITGAFGILGEDFQKQLEQVKNEAKNTTEEVRRAQEEAKKTIKEMMDSLQKQAEEKLKNMDSVIDKKFAGQSQRFEEQSKIITDLRNDFQVLGDQVKAYIDNLNALQNNVISVDKKIGNVVNQVTGLGQRFTKFVEMLKKFEG